MESNMPLSEDFEKAVNVLANAKMRRAVCFINFIKLINKLKCFYYIFCLTILVICDTIFRSQLKLQYFFVTTVKDYFLTRFEVSMILLYIGTIKLSIILLIIFHAILPSE